MTSFNIAILLDLNRFKVTNQTVHRMLKSNLNTPTSLHGLRPGFRSPACLQSSQKIIIDLEDLFRLAFILRLEVIKEYFMNLQVRLQL